MQALRDIFYGSLHMPLADSNTSLYLSVDHPEVDYMVLILLCILPLVDNYAYFCDLPWNSLDAEPYMLVFHLIGDSLFHGIHLQIGYCCHLWGPTTHSPTLLMESVVDV